jgi:hypothetical protein
MLNDINISLTDFTFNTQNYQQNLITVITKETIFDWI